VMAKRLSSCYRPGRRSRAWLKIKPRGIDGCSALGWGSPGAYGPSATVADGIQPVRSQ
jgi:hypothetical protein